MYKMKAIANSAIYVKELESQLTRLFLPDFIKKLS